MQVIGSSILIPFLLEAGVVVDIRHYDWCYILTLAKVYFIWIIFSGVNDGSFPGVNPDLKLIEEHTRFNSYVEAHYRDTVFNHGWGGQFKLKSNQQNEYDFGAYSFM